MNVSVTKAELDKLAASLQAAGITPASATRGQICKAIGVSDRRARTLQGHLRPVGSHAVAGGAPPESHEKTSDKWVVSIPKTRISSLEELLEHCKVDLSVWEVERFVCNKWEVGTSVDKAIVVEPLFQVKAWFKKRVELIAIKDEIAALKEEAKKDAKKYPAIKHVDKNSGYALEISIPDLHYGMLAWHEECGEGNYDTKIAKKVFMDALEALLSRTSSYQFDEVVFVVGNDLMHIDNKAGLTTAGTPQDVDGRYHKSFVAVRKMIADAIERLRVVAPVKVFVVPGNHDNLSAWHIGDSLSCQFANCADVFIDNTPKPRKYYQWGECMILYCHGDKGKLADLPLVMATEQPAVFGATKFREAHTGHLHQLKVQEHHGVRVRVSPALCARDAWHSTSFYTGNQRSAEAFVWSKTEGVVGSAVYTVPTPPEMKKAA